MTRLLLTAFEPFNGETVNPSREVARAVAEVPFEGVHVETLVLPVERVRAVEMSLDRIGTGAPDVVLMLGEGGRRFRVTPERVAINVDDFPIPDNAGAQPRDEPIVEGGPVGYFSTLPVAEIVRHLITADIPAAVSNSAGTYLCNRLFYSVLHHISVAGLPTRAGFIHLPYLHAQTVHKGGDLPGMSRDTLIEAARIAIGVSARAGRVAG